MPDTLREKWNAKRRQFKYARNIAPSLKVLSTVIDALDTCNIDYYLDFGTLLGAMRDKKFIAWDDDIDISLMGLPSKEQIVSLMRVLEKNTHLRVEKSSFLDTILHRKNKNKKKPSLEVYTDNIHFTKQHDIRVIKVAQTRIRELFLGGTMIDIFFKYEHNEELYWMAQDRVHKIPKQILGTEFIEIKFYQLTCRIPKNYDLYLSHLYQEWKVPKTDWQYYEYGTCQDAMGSKKLVGEILNGK